MGIKRGIGKVAGSLTVNHAKRLYNKDSQQAVGMVKEAWTQVNQPTFAYPCPFCSQKNLVFINKHWCCEACEVEYPVYENSEQALMDYMATNARRIYLNGRGVEFSAYERQGGFASSDDKYKKIINSNYLMSKVTLVLAMGSLIFAGKEALDGSLYFLLYLIFAMAFFIYSFLLGFRGYCLATRQMFVPPSMEQKKLWLDTVGLAYFMNVAKGELDLNDIIDDFEAKEARGEIYPLNGISFDDGDDGWNDSERHNV